MSTNNGTDLGPGLRALSDATIEELTMFDLGASYGQYKARVAAFGAIRRAVSLARRADKAAEAPRNYDPYPRTSEITAAAIRRAIRVAIGSDKA